MALSPTSKHLRARIARKSYTLPPNSPELQALRRDLAVERLAEHIEQVLTGNPAPTPAQVTRLHAVINGVELAGV